MTTVFQFGNYSVAKDLVFGWCFIIDEQVVLVRSMDTGVLKAAMHTSYPAYLPDDFKQAIDEELKRREAEAADEERAAQTTQRLREENARKAQAKADETRPFSDFPSVPRHEDRATLMSKIITATVPCWEHGGITTAELGYARVDNLGKGEKPWQATSTNGTEPWCEQFATIDELVDRVLARFW